MLWTSSVIYLVTPLLWLVKTPADMNELRDLHSSALILIASKIYNYGNVGNTPRVSHFSASLTQETILSTTQ